MPTPGKAVSVLENENRSHMTKASLDSRRSAEAAQLTGVRIRERPEVRRNKVAHAEFLRVVKLLVIVGKNDAIYEVVINRYCTIQAECADFEVKREMFCTNLEDLMDNDELDDDVKFRLEAQMQKTILDVDTHIQQKRKMLFDIERENGMTLAAALRSIPKKETHTSDPLGDALGDD